MISQYCIAYPYILIYYAQFSLVISPRSLARVHIQHKEISFQTKLDREINARFLLNEVGTMRGKFPKKSFTVFCYTGRFLVNTVALKVVV